MIEAPEVTSCCRVKLVVVMMIMESASVLCGSVDRQTDAHLTAFFPGQAG